MSLIQNKFIPLNSITLNKLNQNGATTGQYIVWNGSQWVPVTPAYEFLLAATNSVTSNAYASVAALTTPSLPVGTYRWKLTGLAQSTGGGNGIGVRLGLGTAAVSNIFGRWSISQGGNGTDKSFEYDQITATDNVTSASVAAANTNFVIKGEGVVTISNAGTLAIQMRSENNGTGSSLRAGTVLRLEPIG